MRKLNCTGTNYQCGDHCQNSSLDCPSNVSPEAAAKASKLSSLIERQKHEDKLQVKHLIVLAKRLNYDSDSSVSLTEQVMKLKGYDKAKPNLIDEPIEDLIQSTSGKYIARGAGSADFNEDFRNGDQFVGGGLLFGNGSYFATAKTDPDSIERARTVASDYNSSSFDKDESRQGMIQGAISNRAKIGVYRDIDAAGKRLMTDIESRDIPERGKQILSRLASEPGILSMLLGYDGYEVREENFAVLHNRAVLDIVKPPAGEIVPIDRGNITDDDIRSLSPFKNRVETETFIEDIEGARNLASYQQSILDTIKSRK